MPLHIWRLLKDRFEVRDRTFEMRLLHTNIAQRKISGGGARVQTKRSCERQGREAVLFKARSVKPRFEERRQFGANFSAISK